MTEGTTPRDPRDEPTGQAPPPPPPPPAGASEWGQPGGYQQQPGGYQPQPGGYPPQPAGSGLSENVASGLSYVATWITGLIFFLIDKRPEVRFHAMQAILFGVAWLVFWFLWRFTSGAVWVLFSLVQLAFLIGWIVLLVQGFQGRHFKLPVIGDFAEQQARST
jgi:uncharacterized membrane protein